MAIIISGANGIDLQNNPIQNASQVECQDKQLTPFSGFKNYIINGNFDIWQYKDAGLTYPQTSSGYGSDDRWSNNSIGSTKTHSRIDCTDVERALFNASRFSRTVVSSVAGANNYCNKGQSIEDVTRLAGKTVTLSFWAKADANKNIGVLIGQTFGTGGSPSAFVYSNGYLIALTTTWQKKTITMTIPSIVGKTLGTDGVNTSATYLYFGFDIGSANSALYNGMTQQSGTFDIAQVQLEEGSVATPFENRPISLELSLCQRYYQLIQKSGFVASNAYYYETTINLPVPMRAIPTATGTFSVTAGNTGTLSIAGSSNSAIAVYNSASNWTVNVSANTSLQLSAEL